MAPAWVSRRHSVDGTRGSQYTVGDPGNSIRGPLRNGDQRDRRGALVLRWPLDLRNALDARPMGADDLTMSQGIVFAVEDRVLSRLHWRANENSAPECGVGRMCRASRPVK